MFTPPRCPFAFCSRHTDPGEEPFFIRRGYYKPKCRSHAVPRFKCRSCGKGFSRQTFRMDYQDKRPDLNASVFLLLSSGIGLRQTARLTSLSRRCLELKFRKISRHLGRLNGNLRGPLTGTETTLQLDELETFEGRRNTRPLTLPVLIERETRFMIDAVSATIRPRGKMTKKRLAAIAREEEKRGPRRDESKPALQQVLAAGARMCVDLQAVRLETDEKSTYPSLAAEAFGDRLEHATTNSKLARCTWNPLFPINHTEAMLRDLMGRLRRNSWLASKRKEQLDLHLHSMMAYRNYVRPRFNTDKASPAQMLGFVERPLRPTELLSWRQDWGGLSGHPTSANAEPIGA